MKQYNFITNWFFPVNIEEVWTEIVDIQSWPRWWLSWKQAKIQGQESQLQLGSIVNHLVRGRLPYSLQFTTEVTVFEPPNLMELTSKGSLVGRGKWVLKPSSEGTFVTYYWDVGTSNFILNWLASFATVEKLLSKNHDYIMEEGYQGLKARLLRTNS